MTNVAIGAVVVLAFIVVGLAIWLVPRWQVRRWERAGIAEAEKLAELGVQARTSITQAFGGLALIATLAITAYQVNETRRSSDNNLRLAEQGQVSERFSRAVEQLGATNADKSPAIDVRTGGLFSLLRIGLDSKPNTQPAFLVVARYVWNNYEPAPPEKRTPHECAPFHPSRADIATALTLVLPAVGEKLLEDTGEKALRGLRGTNLRGLGLDGLVLRRFDLRGIKLRDAHLGNADFSGSILRSATFDRASLEGVDFRQANLRGSSFSWACLQRANLREADLRGADFTGARLNGADLRSATISPTTDFTSARVEGAKVTEGAALLTSLSKAQRRDAIVVSR